MNTKTLKSSCCVLISSLAFAGCSNLSPEGNAALFGGLAGLAGGAVTKGSGASSGTAAAVGAATAVVVAVTVYIVAKHQATTRQREIAEDHARQAAVGMEVSHHATPAHKSPAKAKPRYIAVDTLQDEKSKGKKSVMIFDTHSQEIVGNNNVYDLKSPPPKGSLAQFENYSAEYVGDGSLK